MKCGGDTSVVRPSIAPAQSSSIDEYDEDEERVRVVEARENREARLFTSFSSYSGYSVDRFVDDVRSTTGRRVYGDLATDDLVRCRSR